MGKDEHFSLHFQEWTGGNKEHKGNEGPGENKEDK
jgi:hypothetical protein